MNMFTALNDVNKVFHQALAKMGGIQNIYIVKLVNFWKPHFLELHRGIKSTLRTSSDTWALL